MATQATAVGKRKAAAGGKDGRIKKLTKAQAKLQAAIDSKNEKEAQNLLHQSISLISDACVFNHGFGAVLRHGR